MRYSELDIKVGEIITSDTFPFPYNKFKYRIKAINDTKIELELINGEDDSP